jgi:hypothetical protein
MYVHRAALIVDGMPADFPGAEGAFVEGRSPAGAVDLQVRNDSAQDFGNRLGRSLIAGGYGAHFVSLNVGVVSGGFLTGRSAGPGIDTRRPPAFRGTSKNAFILSKSAGRVRLQITAL